MSGIQGKNGRQIRKLQVAESNIPSVGFKNVRALHEAAVDDTVIDVTSLTAPADAVANGYLAPTLGDLTAVNLMQFKSNVTVRTGTGQLIQDIDYVINGATTIRLIVPAQDAQVFEILIDASPRTGMTLVDAAPLVQTGILAADTTDFNVGEPFEIGKFPSKQVGSVMVFADGQQLWRNVGNQSDGEGDYYEVHAGAGLGTIIRLNSTDSEDRQILVVSVGALTGRPDGSFEALVQTLQGQVDNHREILEAVTETIIAPGAPNDVDLKAFGDRVIDLEKILDAEVPSMTDWTGAGTIDISATTTPPTKGTIVLDQVQWRQVGDSIEVRMEYEQSAIGANGSGMYLFKMPASKKIDTTKVTPDTREVNGTGIPTQASNSVGFFHHTEDAGSDNTSIGPVVVYDEDYVACRFITSTQAGTASTGGFGSSVLGLAGAPAVTFTLHFTVPIQGLKAKQTIREQLGL